MTYNTFLGMLRIYLDLLIFKKYFSAFLNKRKQFFISYDLNSWSLKEIQTDCLIINLIAKPSVPKKAEPVEHPDYTARNHETTKQEHQQEHLNAEDSEEPIYESRKLLIRQMQGMIAKEVLKDRKGTVGSEYDSWSDLEENFARAYEPIPLNINMETWRQMSKKEILKTVKSRQIRKEFEYMTHAEIIGSIEKMQLSAKYLSNKFGVDHLLQHNHPPLTKKQLERAKQKGRDVDLESISSGFAKDAVISRAEIVKNSQQMQYLAASQKHDENMKKVPNFDHFANGNVKSGSKIHDSWSSRASSILKDPASIYVSREEVLANLKADILRAAPPPKG